MAFLPCTKTVHKSVVFLQKKIFGCGIYKNLSFVGPPGPGGGGSAKRGIASSFKPPISHCGMTFHNAERILRCNIAYMVRCNIGTMVRCNIATMASWSLCGATYPIRHDAVQHNTHNAIMVIWGGCLNRAGI